MKNFLYKNNLKGFTLPEMLISIGIFTAVVAISLPIFVTRPKESLLLRYASDLEYSFFSQQLSAYAGKDNNSYGIALYNNKFSLYRGSSLATGTKLRETTFSPEIRISFISLNTAGTEVVFNQGEFRPSAYGLIKLTDGIKSKDLRISSEGIIWIE